MIHTWSNCSSQRCCSRSQRPERLRCDFRVHPPSSRLPRAPAIRPSTLPCAHGQARTTQGCVHASWTFVCKEGRNSVFFQNLVGWCMSTYRHIRTKGTRTYELACAHKNTNEIVRQNHFVGIVTGPLGRPVFCSVPPTRSAPLTSIFLSQKTLLGSSYDQSDFLNTKNIQRSISYYLFILFNLWKLIWHEIWLQCSQCST